jgi:hypothetical protein
MPDALADAGRNADAGWDAYTESDADGDAADRV